MVQLNSRYFILRGEYMSICYIVCSLDCKLDFEPTENDYVIGADRGYQILKEQNKRIDLIVGDFDSSNEPTDSYKVIKYPIMKDETDSAIAIKHAIEKCYKKIVIYGAIGGTLDHTIANISLICKYAEKGIDISLVDGENVVFAISNSKISFSDKANGRISVFSHNDISYGVYETGLLYSLDNYSLDNKTSLGSGNSFIGKEAIISVENGTLLIYTSKNNFDNYLTK